MRRNNASRSYFFRTWPGDGVILIDLYFSSNESVFSIPGLPVLARSILLFHKLRTQVKKKNPHLSLYGDRSKEDLAISNMRLICRSTLSSNTRSRYASPGENVSVPW